MIALTKILRVILREDAEAEKDISQATLSDEYIGYIDKQISSYSTNNSVIRKIEDGQFDAIEINFDTLSIQISANYSSQVHDADFVPGKGAKKKAFIKINKAKIKTTPNLQVKFDESALKHELKHYYDSLENTDEFRKNVDKQFKINTRKGTVKDTNAYWNNPNEVNAYFFEHFIPDVLKMLKKEKDIPSTLDDFKKDIFKNPGSSSFYQKLNDENKKKIDKRLETYYKDILTNSQFKIQNTGKQIDNNKLEKSTYSFFKRLKDKLGLFQE